jgi:hypothetical protein
VPRHPGRVEARPGDIINVDVTTLYKGFHGDTSATFFVGEPSAEARHVTEVARQSLELGIAVVRDGARIGDIGEAIEDYADAQGCSVVRDFVGHGIGRKFHTEPQVPHYKPGRNAANPRMRSGMAFTIEPMINLGTWEVDVDPKDKWTVRTKDRRLSAQFEHTIVVTRTGCEVLTRRSRPLANSENIDMLLANGASLHPPTRWTTDSPATSPTSTATCSRCATSPRRSSRCSSRTTPAPATTCAPTCASCSTTRSSTCSTALGAGPTLGTAQEKARAFHEKWVVGYGHSSVAEHAVVHLAVERCSILAAKALEEARLAAYTEKSTRYVRFDEGTLVTDIGLPAPLAESYESTRAGCSGVRASPTGSERALFRADPMPEGVNPKAHAATLRAHAATCCGPAARGGSDQRGRHHQRAGARAAHRQAARARPSRRCAASRARCATRPR